MSRAVTASLFLPRLSAALHLLLAARMPDPGASFHLHLCVRRTLHSRQICTRAQLRRGLGCLPSDLDTMFISTNIPEEKSTEVADKDLCR